MAELVFFTGTMDCGKSTLALQVDHNHARHGRTGLVLRRLDRAGRSVLSSRLGLADRVEPVQVEAFRWCGRRATHNARTVDGIMVVEGRQVVPGDVEDVHAGEVGYEVLCRRHHHRRLTATVARAAGTSPAADPPRAVPG